jgi:hypothetical protein
MKKRRVVNENINSKYNLNKKLPVNNKWTKLIISERILDF